MICWFCEEMLNFRYEIVRALSIDQNLTIKTMKRILLLFSVFAVLACDPTGDTTANRAQIYTDLPVALYEDALAGGIGEVINEAFKELYEFSDYWDSYVDWDRLAGAVRQFMEIGVEDFDYEDFRKNYMHKYDDGTYGMPTYNDYMGYEWMAQRVVGYYDLPFAEDVFNSYKDYEYDLNKQDKLLSAADYMIAMAYFRTEMPQVVSCEYDKEKKHFYVRLEDSKGVQVVYVKFHEELDGKIAMDYSSTPL